MRRPITGLTALLMALVIAAAPAEDLHPAQALVMQTTNEILSRLRAERDTLGAASERVSQLVEQIVLPHIDFESVSASVLGKYWRTADADQRRRFRAAFKSVLLSTYGIALVDNMDREIEYEPVRARPGATDVTVRTSIPQATDFPIPINYSMELIDGEWKVYDIEIDGLSVVLNYRTSFAKEIGRSSLENLIRTLEEHGRGGGE
jgi:phospholipid transport system substrate-binding protein